jgi:chromosome segregation ATPase
MEEQNLSATLKQLFETLNKLPDEIKNEEEKIINSSLRKQTFQMALESQERIATLQVLNSKDENGKQKYTNDISRKTAIDDLLANNPDYLKIKLDMLETEKEIMQSKMEYDFHKNRFKAIQTMVDLVGMGSTN